jgi:hypothetical protein
MFTRLLTILPLLLCPLLMLACMWAMRNRETPQRQARAGQEDLPTAARVAQLERELAELRARLPEAGTAAKDASAPQPHPSQAAVQGAPTPPGLTGPR